MTEQHRKEAIEYIEAQLENGYIDLGAHDQDELEIVKEAINTLKTLDEINNKAKEWYVDISNKLEREVYGNDLSSHYE